VGSVLTADEGVMGEESSIGGELAGGDEMGGRVGGAALDGSETGSLWACWADGWGIEGGSVPILSLKPEYREDVIGFVADSGSSSAGKFAESSGSDATVDVPNACESIAEELEVSLRRPTGGVVVDTPPNPEGSYSNARELSVADCCAKVDQGSGEPERGRAKGSSKGFSSNAREDCRKRSSKPDMMNHFPASIGVPSPEVQHAAFSHTIIYLPTGPINGPWQELTYETPPLCVQGCACVCERPCWASFS
jgi:hypothetical protein